MMFRSIQAKEYMGMVGNAWPFLKSDGTTLKTLLQAMHPCSLIWSLNGGYKSFDILSAFEYSEDKLINLFDDHNVAPWNTPKRTLFPSVVEYKLRCWTNTMPNGHVITRDIAKRNAATRWVLKTVPRNAYKFYTWSDKDIYYQSELNDNFRVYFDSKKHEAAYKLKFG